MGEPKPLLGTDPQVVLRGAINFTLGVALGLQKKKALQAIGGDVALSERAAGKILHHLLRVMASNEEPNGAQYRALIDELCTLTRES